MIHYQIKTLFQVTYEDIPKVVHPYLLSAYYQQTRLMSRLDDYDILLIDQLPFHDGILDPSGNIKYDVDFTLRGHFNNLIKQHQLGDNKVRQVGGAYRPVVESPKPEKIEKELSEYEKHGVKRETINATSPTIEEMLTNPELDGISSVNIDPVSIAVETVVDLIDGVKEFVSNPSLGGMAVTAIPGKYADKILDELPLKKLDKAMAKTLHTMKRFKVPCFKPGKTIKGKFKGRERELESHFARQLKSQESGLNDLTVGEYLENRNRYKVMKRKGTGLAQEEFRKDFSNDLKESLKNNYNKKMLPKEAKTKAEQRTLNIMDNLAALHDPDMIAGGGDKVNRMGNKSVNSSLGSQWRRESRLAKMDAQAQKALETVGSDTKMNVTLERCPVRGNK
ncbi:polymorphic toxin type 15 domain-containing protein [Aliivibrio wodanis]|uniref:polymorphic toxin type 15 domain-containing protein n=1 Tax=Aliivibrio wodanis TaxID=80852 RepID=UPI00406D10DA